MKIKQNLAKCKSCGEVLESTHVHDFRTCKCGKLSVDGGKDYSRRVFDGPYEELTTYEPE